MAGARPRSRLAIWLAVLGGLCIALGSTGLWAQRTLGDPETFAGLAGEILERPEIRTQLAVVIVDPVLENAPAVVQQQRAFIVTTTAGVLGNPRFVPVFEVVLERAATRLLQGQGAVRLDLGRPLDLVVAEVNEISPELAAELASIDPPAPEVVSAEQADRLRAFVAFERAASLVLLVAGIVLAVVAVATGGGRSLLPFGATLAGACLVLFAALLAGRALLLGAIEPAERAEAAESAWNIVVADLQTALLLGAAAGVVALVAGGVLGRRS